MDKQIQMQRLDAALSKFLQNYKKESGAPVAMISNWEQGTIQISIQEVQK